MLSNINKIGFIGCGKMGGAIISGVKNLNRYSIIGVEAGVEQAKFASDRLGVPVVTDLERVVKESDIIFVALKPQYVLSELEKVRELIADKLIVSVAAGVTISKIEAIAKNASVIRVMPNTPALIGEGVFGVAKGNRVSQEQLECVVELLSGLGECIEISEMQIDVVTALSGSGPAFFYKVIHEMACGATELGLEYDKALKFALKTAVGSAKMIEQTNIPVETLIANVATKGGCTAVGVDFMNERKTDELFAELINVTTKKAKALG